MCSSSPRSSEFPNPQTPSRPEPNQTHEGVLDVTERDLTVETESPLALNESSFIHTLQIDEEVSSGNAPTTSASVNRSPTNSSLKGHGEEVPEVSVSTRPDKLTTPQKTMDEPYPDFAREVLGAFISLPRSQPHSHHYSQCSASADAGEATSENAASNLPDRAMGDAASSFHSIGQQVSTGMAFDQHSPSSLTITRQEVAALTDVLGRISHHLVAGEESRPSDALTLTVVDDYAQLMLFTTSSQEDVSAPTTSMNNPQQPLPGNTTTRGKRRRPKFSLTIGMLKKHPILKFSATVPLDAEISPHKWW